MALFSDFCREKGCVLACGMGPTGPTGSRAGSSPALPSRALRLCSGGRLECSLLRLTWSSRSPAAGGSRRALSCESRVGLGGLGASFRVTEPVRHEPRARLGCLTLRQDPAHLCKRGGRSSSIRVHWQEPHEGPVSQVGLASAWRWWPAPGLTLPLRPQPRSRLVERYLRIEQVKARAGHRNGGE